MSAQQNHYHKSAKRLATNKLGISRKMCFVCYFSLQLLMTSIAVKAAPSRESQMNCPEECRGFYQGCINEGPAHLLHFKIWEQICTSHYSICCVVVGLKKRKRQEYGDPYYWKPEWEREQPDRTRPKYGEPRDDYKPSSQY